MTIFSVADREVSSGTIICSVFAVVLDWMPS